MTGVVALEDYKTWGVGITAHYLRAVRGIERVLDEEEAKVNYRARK